MKKQTKQFAAAVLGIGLLAVGIKAYSSSLSSDTATEGDGHLAVSEDQWDLGQVPMSEGIVTREIKLTNDSNDHVTITRMETSCMCTTAQVIHENGSRSGVKGMVGHAGMTPIMSEDVEPGATVTLLIKFDPNAHGPDATGPINRLVELTTNSQKQPIIKLRFTGNVVK